MGFIDRQYRHFMGHAKRPRPVGRLSGSRIPPFWRRELDIEDVGVVEAFARRMCGQGFADFAGGEGEGRAARDALQEQLHPAGIYGVPSFVFDRQVLFGREHLPYVSWHLDGRKGTAPDMAYEL